MINLYLGTHQRDVKKIVAAGVFLAAVVARNGEAPVLDRAPGLLAPQDCFRPASVHWLMAGSAPERVRVGPMPDTPAFGSSVSMTMSY